MDCQKAGEMLNFEKHRECTEGLTATESVVFVEVSDQSLR